MRPEGSADRSMDLAHLLSEHYRVESFHHLSYSVSSEEE